METQNKVAVFLNEKGIVSVHNFAHNIYVPKEEVERLETPFLCIGDGSVEDYEHYRKATIEELIEKDLPKGIEVHIVEKDQIPEDRYFRNAWEHDKGEISVNMEKAVEIQKDYLRELRAPILEALDLDYMFADENGDLAKKQEIVERKKALRDITKSPEIAAATTPEELKEAAVSVISGE